MYQLFQASQMSHYLPKIKKIQESRSTNIWHEKENYFWKWDWRYILIYTYDKGHSFHSSVIWLFLCCLILNFLHFFLQQEKLGSVLLFSAAMLLLFSCNLVRISVPIYRIKVEESFNYVWLLLWVELGNLYNWMPKDKDVRFQG